MAGSEQLLPGRTDVLRRTKHVLRVAASGETVQVKDHGRPLVKILPDLPRQEVSIEEFRAAEMSDEAIVEAVSRSHSPE